jgi:hypothetical protein
VIVLGAASSRLAVRPVVCILDARLLLEPLGLLFASRLARHGETWLVRRLWSVLDNDAFYQRWPLELGAECTAEHLRSLAKWRAAWLDGELNQRFFWVGDARYESVLPAEIDTSLRDRFDCLLAELDPQQGEGCAPALSVLDECARDCLALAAALENDNPLILTACAGNETPPLVSLAERLGVFGPIVIAHSEGDLIPESVFRVIAPLVPFGLTLAAAHLIAPEATVMRSPSADEWDGSTESPASHWSQARLIWRAVRCAVQ